MISQSIILKTFILKVFAKIMKPYRDTARVNGLNKKPNGIWGNPTKSIEEYLMYE